MNENIPGSMTRRHGLAMIEFISTLLTLAFFIWFLDLILKWEGKGFNPSSAEKTLGINYNIQDITVVFLTIVSISVIVYAICAGVTVSHSEKIDLKASTLSAAIIPGILGMVLFLNGGMSYDAQQKVNKSYEDKDKKNSKKDLQSRNIPYDNMGAASYAAGSVQVAMMIVILCYYYLYFLKEKPPPPPPPRVYVPPPPPPPPVPKNYLENDRVVRRGTSTGRVKFED